jgi:hypothetical protein
MQGQMVELLQEWHASGFKQPFQARIQAEAEPGGIPISYPTWALVRTIVRAEERGSIAAKTSAFSRSPAFSTIPIRHPSPARKGP